jgi:hypothetical protein
MDKSHAQRTPQYFHQHAEGLLRNFTGREWLVERVCAWRDDPQARPFALIQGTAGIGKSAFAAHLWLEQKMVTAVHFCIGGSGGTTDPLTFVETLSAQLADALPGFARARQRVLEAYSRQPMSIQSQVSTGEVHEGGQVTGVAVYPILSGIPVEQAYDLLIRRPLWEIADTDGLHPALILVDALDEALTYRFRPNILGLLRQSGDLPPAVRWLLTSRPEPRITEALTGLPLEILDATVPQHQDDVRAYIRARLGELEATAARWRVDGEALIDLLGKRVEWNFLYLTSIWGDLAQGRFASPEDLPPSLDDYYRYLLDTRIGHEAWDEWGADLLEVLLALQEPVDLETLSAFLGWPPRPTLQRLNRIAQTLSPTFFQQGLYYRHHWSLVEFLRQPKQTQLWYCDLVQGHRRIAAALLRRWGGLEAGLPALRDLEAPDYGTCYLVSHLLQGGQYDEVARLLRLEWDWNGRPVHAWYTVHERIGTPQDFLRDLQRAWQAAAEANREAAEKGRWCPCLGDEIRYALLEASLHSLAGNIPPKLLAALVREGVWTPAQGLSYARQVPEDGQRAEALAGLAPHLPRELLAEALAAVREIRYAGDRSKTLVGLASHLPAELLAEALAAAREIRDEEYRAKALAALAPHLSQEQRETVLAEALVAAREIEYESTRAEALARLAPHLPADLLAAALAAARGIRDERWRAKALAGLIPHLPEELRREVLAEALAVAREIKGEDGRARALAALAPHLPQEQREAVLAEALAAAREIRDEEYRAKALAALAPHLPGDLLAKALTAAREIESEWYRAEALAGLAPHLPEELLAVALVAAREIRDEDDRAEALAGLAPHLPEELLAVALVAARTIKSE